MLASHHVVDGLLQADGVNIHGAHRHILVENCSIPHTGDDRCARNFCPSRLPAIEHTFAAVLFERSFAMWSKGSSETNITFRGNYAASPRYPRSWLASCFAMYGGRRASFVDNTCVQSGQRGALYLTDGALVIGLPLLNILLKPLSC
jgi:hypothetical protein